jgi:hypothetical protein
MSRRFAFSIAAAAIAGCAGGNQLPAAPAGASSNFVRTGVPLVAAHRATPRAGRLVIVSTIRPHCCARTKTVFVTDAFGGSSYTGAVYAFDFKTAKELGQLSPPPEGWSEVQGACTDRQGNAYFANTAMSTIDEYTHDGTYLATLNDAGQYPADCAYDRSSGNLAVSNVIGTSGGSGSISIFHGGVLQNTYYPPHMSVYFLGYQGGTGTLWLDGFNASGGFQYDEFANGTFTPVPIVGGSIGFPGGVQWSAKTHAMNVGDQDTFSAPTIYQVSPAGKIVGSTVLTCSLSLACDVVTFAIKGSGIVAADAAYLTASLYPYPAGGAPIRSYVAPYVQPIGTAISPNVP